MKYIPLIFILMCYVLPVKAVAESAPQAKQQNSLQYTLPKAQKPTAPAHDGKIRVVDDTGYELVLDKPVQRVLGLYGALSELMLDLGLGHTLVGRTIADKDVEGLKHLPPVGTHMRPKPELIVALKPDVILQFLGRKQDSSLGLGLRKLGVPVLLFHLESFEDMYSVLERLGKITGTEAKAAELIKSYTNRLGFLRTTLMYEKRVPVFFELRYPNLLTVGGKSIITDILFTAGARNIIASSDPLVRVSEEELLAKNPEAYIIQKGSMNPSPKPMNERPNYDKLQAVINNKILTLNEVDFARPGPRAVDAAEKLARWLHPTVDFSLNLPQANANMKKD